jgi:hypothetical protein
LPIAGRHSGADGTQQDDSELGKVVTMTEIQSGQATEFDLFDEDVDVGEEAPENDDFDDDEMAGIETSRAGSNIPPDTGEAS